MWHCNSCNLDFKERMNTVLKRYLTSETKSLKDICPYCTHLLPNPKTDSIDVVKPLLIEEWQSDIYGSISAVFPSSTAKVNWKCRRCQGEFEARICEREENDNCCPYCFGRKVLPGYNLFDVTQPILVKEWDYLNNILLANPSESVKRVGSMCGGPARIMVNIGTRCPYIIEFYLRNVTKNHV